MAAVTHPTAARPPAASRASLCAMPPILHGASAAGQRQHGRKSSISEEDLSRAGSSHRGSLTGLDGGTAELCARLEAIAQKLEGSGVGGGASAEAIKKLLDEQQKRWARARPARLAAPPWRRPRSQLAARAAGLLWLPLS